MNILLTFTGFHDPYVEGMVEGAKDTGPVLTVVNHHPFDLVCLFTTPSAEKISKETKAAIAKISPKTKVQICDVPLADPTNYVGILKNIRKHYREISRKHPEAKYFISVSSGTPHMHGAWVLLAASGEIPAKVLQSNAAKFATEKKGRVTEIDLHHEVFPTVLQAPPDTETQDLGSRIAEARRELKIVGEDPAFLKALEEAATFAEYDGAHVLLLGETGSGKEFFANFIHYLGARRRNALGVVNCATVSEQLADSKLFGHKKGSFTGANSDNPGFFKANDGRMVFLDELGELPMSIQAKLLRLLEQGEVQAVGENSSQKVDVRIVAATNRDLLSMSNDGTFRQDLFERFTCKVRIPALRQRRSDIPILAAHILERWNAERSASKRLANDAVAALMEYHWPRNVRELKNVIENSAMLARGKTIREEDLRFEKYASNTCYTLPEPDSGFELGAFIDKARAELIERAMEKADRVQARAARMLGITPQALHQFYKTQKNQ